MQKITYKEDTGPSWWTAPRIIRIIAFTLSGASLGTAIWENTKVDKRLGKAKTAFKDAESLIVDDLGNYDASRSNYNNLKKELRNAENLRNILYISAGAFGAIGLVSFVF